jgi:putative inorganic carbon (HCO3(-)) transporter
MELRTAIQGARRGSAAGERSPVLNVLLQVAILVGAYVVGKLAATRPVEMVGVVGAGVVAVGALLRPNISTYAVLFLVYSNVVGVAIRVHGMPRIAGALFILLLVIPVGHALLIERRKLVITPVFSILLIFFCVQCVSLVFARDPAIGFEPLQDYFFEGVVLYLLVTNAVRSPTALRGAIWALVAAGLLMSAPALHQQLTGNYDSNYGGMAQLDGSGFYALGEEGASLQPRLCGPIGEKNRYAQIMLMLLPLSFYLWWSERSKALRITALGISAFIAAGFTLAFSRGGGVGAAAVVVVMVVLRLIDVRRLAMLAAGVFLLLLAFPQYWQRMGTLESAAGIFSSKADQPVDGAIRGRLTEMLAAVSVYMAHPVIGVGPGQFKYYLREYSNESGGAGFRRMYKDRRAHTLFPEIGAEVGTLGLGAFVLMLVKALTSLNKVRRRCAGRHRELSGMATAFLLVLVSYIATGTFLHLAYHRYFFMMLALAGAVVHVANQELARSEAAEKSAAPGAAGPAPAAT